MTDFIKGNLSSKLYVLARGKKYRNSMNSPYLNRHINRIHRLKSGSNINLRFKTETLTKCPCNTDTNRTCRFKVNNSSRMCSNTENFRLFVYKRKRVMPRILIFKMDTLAI